MFDQQVDLPPFEHINQSLKGMPSPAEVSIINDETENVQTREQD